MHAAETCRLHAARRAGCAPQDAPVARRKTRRLRAARRAGCAPQDAPVARRKTCRLRPARHAVCTPEDAQIARRKTCWLHVAKRAGCTPQDMPVARRACRRAGEAGRPVRPFCSRSGLPELCGRAAEREASRPAWPLGAQGVPRAPKGTCQTLEPKPGRREAKVPPGRKEAERKRSTQRSETCRFENQARARTCARWPSAPGNFTAKPKHGRDKQPPQKGDLRKTYGSASGKKKKSRAEPERNSEAGAEPERSFGSH